MAGNGHAHRQLDSWIEGFVRLTDAKPSPPMFRRWAAVATIASALERKCWTISNHGVLYPNLYIILTGPPASGKTVARDAAYALLKTVDGIRIAPTSVTSASIIDDVKRAAKTFRYNNEVVLYHSLQVFSRELSHLIPEYEVRQMSNFIDFYDCNDDFEESRRGREEQVSKIPNVQLNMLACTTPSYLGGFLPEAAWNEGFASRLLLIYQGVKIWKEPFDLDDDEDDTKTAAHQLYDQTLYNQVVCDLKQIATLTGKFRWAREVQQAYRDWSFAGGPPTPEHPKLTYYNERRSATLMKLCAVVSASHSNNMVITLEDYQTALGLLLDAESVMGDIFKAMSGGASAGAIQSTWAFIWELYAKSGKRPISDELIYRFISERTTTPTHSVAKLVETMVKSGLLEPAGLVGTRTQYRPLQRSAH